MGPTFVPLARGVLLITFKSSCGVLRPVDGGRFQRHDDGEGEEDQEAHGEAWNRETVLSFSSDALKNKFQS